MALLLSKSIFFHIPKTGGSWVRRALKNAGLRGEELLCARHSLPRGAQMPTFCCRHNFTEAISVDCEKKFTFAFVRNPLSHYQSYWSYRMIRGWDTRNAFDRKFAFDDFEAFVRNVVDHCPNRVSCIYEKYLGESENFFGELDFVGKQETLEIDLIRALRKAGEEFDEEKLLATPRENLASSLPEWETRCTYTPELEERVRKAEERAMERFGYI